MDGTCQVASTWHVLYVACAQWYCKPAITPDARERWVCMLVPHQLTVDCGIPWWDRSQVQERLWSLRRFLYIDMENVHDHVFRPASTSGNTVDHLRDFEPVLDFGSKVKALNSFPSMVPPVAPIENLYFTGVNHRVLTFARLFYKCKDKYFIYWFRRDILISESKFYLRVVVENYDP